ncbi:transposase family protein [Streptomyces sp. NPDC001732]
MEKLPVDGVSTKIHHVPPGASLACLSFPNLSASLEQGRPHSIDLSTRTLRYLAGQLASRRREIGTRWRRLTASRQALLALAHLRCGDTCAQLAAGFGIGLAAVYRSVRETIDVLAVLAPALDEATATARTKAYVILDGTVLPIDRIAADRPCYSGKKRHHGMNVQVLTDPFGRLLWASPALPGATHDLTAAREHGIIDALPGADLKCWADKAYQGAARNVRGPLKGRRLKRWQRRHNTTHAKIRCAGEQAMATLKSRRLLRKLRCSTTRITAIVKAVLALQLAAASG